MCVGGGAGGGGGGDSLFSRVFLRGGVEVKRNPSRPPGHK